MGPSWPSNRLRGASGVLVPGPHTEKQAQTEITGREISAAERGSNSWLNPLKPGDSHLPLLPQACLILGASSLDWPFISAGLTAFKCVLIRMLFCLVEQVSYDRGRVIDLLTLVRLNSSLI